MFVLLLLACVTEESYPSQAATAVCSRALECDKGDFEESYDDVPDCADDYEEIVECYAENCDFNAQDAADALSDLRRAECDDADQAAVDLGDAYDDCDEFAVGACLMGF